MPIPEIIYRTKTVLFVVFFRKAVFSFLGRFCCFSFVKGKVPRTALHLYSTPHKRLSSNQQQFSGERCGLKAATTRRKLWVSTSNHHSSVLTHWLHFSYQREHLSCDLTPIHPHTASWIRTSNADKTLTLGFFFVVFCVHLLCLEAVDQQQECISQF